jgi:two-component system CheB/CheR fusion protein
MKRKKAGNEGKSKATRAKARKKDPASRKKADAAGTPMAKASDAGRRSGATSRKDPHRGKAPQTLRSERAAKRSLPVAGIGASAGGIRALQELVAGLPKDLHMALIVVQHLEPKHKSMLAEILSKSSALPVVQARDGMKLEPGRIFVIPPNRRMEVHDGRLTLSELLEPSKRMLVDALLESLASAYQHLAIGIVLSGSGSDGTFGVRAVKSEGGITFAQSRESAEYFSMPQHAIATGSVDFMLSPTEIARKLVEISDHPYLKGQSVVPEGREVEVQDSLLPIFSVLRRAKGVDFSLYRRSTVERRVERRMALNRLEDYDAYLQLLKTKPQELNLLYEDLLIQVTSFFRQPELYTVLAEKIFPRLVEDRSEDDDLRVWVPGCSTGEEAYSMAMSFCQFLDTHNLMTPVRVFATDLNESLIERARTGFYPESISEQVPPGLLTKYFDKTNGGYEVQRFLRDLCVFARHDLTRDPPFSSIDLLSCQNVMIYLQPVLQDRLLPVFHYALKPKGYLVLGSSESIGGATDLFQPVDKKHRIYSKRLLGRRPELDFDQPFRPSRPPQLARKLVSRTPPDEAADLERKIDDILLSRHMPAAVLIDRDQRIVSFRGNTGPFLQPAPGRASLHLMSMIRPGLALDLGSALQSADSSNETVKRHGLQVEADGRPVSVDLEVTPIGTHGDFKYFLVIFRAVPTLVESATAPRTPTGRQKSVVEKLRREVADTKRQLQSIIEQKEAANEELKSANEEIRSSNEELQSLNEELETSREELQSSNEELSTLNDQLQARNLELGRVNSDLSNILENAQIPIIIVGEDLTIRLFTPSANKLLNIRDSDSGRPITDITLRAEIPDLPDLIARTMTSMVPTEREIQDASGTWYELRVRPYVGLDKRIEGAVISFIDINELKQNLQKSHEAEILAKRAMDMAPVPMAVLDRSLKIVTVNRAFETSFATSKERAEGQKFFVLNGGMFDVPEVAECVEKSLPKKGSIEGLGFRLKSPAGGDRPMFLSGHRLDGTVSSGPHFLLSFSDGQVEPEDPKGQACP